MHKLLTRQHIDFNCRVHGTKITAGLCKVMQITTIFYIDFVLNFPLHKVQHSSSSVYFMSI